MIRDVLTATEIKAGMHERARDRLSEEEKHILGRIGTGMCGYLQRQQAIEDEAIGKPHFPINESPPPAL